MQTPPPQTAPSHNRSRHMGAGHLKPLDGVRGLAILMVVFSHLFQVDYQHSTPLFHLIGNILFYGSFGVDLFFVLSGFLITGILVDSLADSGFFRKFYARRVLRIFPLYYAVLFVLFALTPLLHLVWNGMGVLLLLYAQNIRPHQIMSFSPGSGIDLNHFWSLAIEEQFYLVWPAIVFFGKTHRRLMAIALAFSALSLVVRLYLLAHGGTYFTVHANTLTRADSLLLGGVLALLYRSSIWNGVLRLAPAVFALSASFVVASLLITFPFFETQIWAFGFRYTLLAMASCALIAWSLSPKTLITSLFQLPLLRFFGKYSYGIYVLHLLFLHALLSYLRPGLFSLTHSKAAAIVLAGAIAFTASIAAAVLSFHLFEKHFLRLKRYFDYDSPRLSRQR